MSRTRCSRGMLASQLAASAGLLWVGLSGAGAQGTEQGNGTPAATLAIEHVVGIQYLKYAPDPIEIMAGETVNWVNHDALPHTVTAAQGDIPTSETLGLGDSYQETFTTPGTFEYICLYHKQMHGTIVVRGE